ncbi:MAG: hypothetical protein F6K47_13845 [Symploca sp. SIO2E6]|nr:hypothetical protein [Symploca sp. SIO2E6]
MPKESVYRRQARANEGTAKAARLGFPDWAVIMCFYAALHWINDYALRQGKKIYDSDVSDSSQHSARRKYVKKLARDNKWGDLQDAYQTLYQASMTARYLEDLEGKDITAIEHYAKYGVDFAFKCLEIIKNRLED